MYDGIVQDLIDEFGRLPGIGPKSAQRITFHILQSPSFDVSRLATLLAEVREKVRFCEICGNVSEQDRCAICRDPRRNPAVICVVEDAKDVAAIERTREFRGLYHVLGGVISPIAGIGPEDLRITQLMQRLADGTVQEVILATNPNLEGEATATYLSRLLHTLEIAVTRLASGLPVGGDLEYADEVTLGRAFEGRRRRSDRRGAQRNTSTSAIHEISRAVMIARIEPTASQSSAAPSPARESTSHEIRRGREANPSAALRRAPVLRCPVSGEDAPSAEAGKTARESEPPIISRQPIR